MAPPLKRYGTTQKLPPPATLAFLPAAPLKLGLQNYFAVFTLLRHISFVLLFGVAVCFLRAAGVAILQMATTLQSGLNAAASGASYLAVIGLFARTWSTVCAVGPWLTPIAMAVRTWAFGSTAPLALAAAPLYATVELQHIAAATLAFASTFKCLFGGNND